MTGEDRLEKLKRKYNLPDEQDIPEEKDCWANVANNLQYLKDKYSIEYQKDLAEILDIEAQTLSKIKSGQQLPSVFPLLANIKKRFGYSIDDVLFTDIRTAEGNALKIQQQVADTSLPVAMEMDFQGVYQAYYFTPQLHGGRSTFSHDGLLKSGILYIEKKQGYGKVYGNRCPWDGERRGRFFYRENGGNARKQVVKKKLLKRDPDGVLYHGELELSRRNIFINLSMADKKVQMVFYHPESYSRRYIGGLGAMVSAFGNKPSAPCIQCVAMSDTSLDVSEAELSAYLLMHYPEVKAHGDIDGLTEFTALLYAPGCGQEARLSSLPDKEKKHLVQSYIDKIVNDTVEENLFRTVTVSPDEDDKFYHYLKRVRETMHQTGVS